MFHEPIFPSGVANAVDIRARRKALIEEGIATGGVRAASELVLRSVAGEETYESLDPELRERLLGNGEVLLNIEMSAYLEYEPSPGQLALMRLPRVVTAGADNRDTTVPGHWRYESATGLAAQLDTPLAELPGGHMGYLGQPRPFAEALRSHLDKVS